MGMLFCFVLFSNSGRRKKNQRVPRSRSRRHECSHPFFHSLPPALYKPKRLFSSRVGAPREGRGHLPHLSMYLIVHHLSVYFPHTISSHSAPHPDCRFRDLYDIILSSSIPHIYSLVLFFNFSQTVIAIRLSL